VEGCELYCEGEEKDEGRKKRERKLIAEIQGGGRGMRGRSMRGGGKRKGA
jgi:hypothetical protein